MFYKVTAVDFDGTLCENKWPDIGEPNDEILDYLKDQKEQGVKLVLWTCRVGQELAEAVVWCKEHGLEFDAINENVPEAIELFGSDTRKIYADEYIDDKACTQFKLPFVRTKKEITDEIIGKLERVFGFTLYDWQRRYLKGDDTVFPKGVRVNGKTFAYCVRLLIGDHEPVGLSGSRALYKLIDEPHLLESQK